MRRILLLACASMSIAFVSAQQTTLTITRQYLNYPISHDAAQEQMSISANGEQPRSFVIRLTTGEPEYWVFSDMTPYLGKQITIRYAGDPAGLDKIYQSDRIAGADSMYRESRRPQVHFTTRRGWINDPNGLLWHEGEYHLFYQHNPYEREWQNMHWGHAVSRDLIHWQELPDALYPDHLGTAFSGSAVIDHDNTAGFNRDGIPAMVALYTAAAPDRQTQCLAYSLDRGRTWEKYADNPVIDSKQTWDSNDTRDPKVFWYAPGKHWVMVLNERDGQSIYTSGNLKEWTYRSHTTGFWECPELFELPVDGDKTNTKWVMYGASGTYMVGSFDGQTFKPEEGKYQYITGKNYAAQTFTGIPDDGRRIQIGWGRLSHPNMPFNGIMLFPTELTLHKTRNGTRLQSRPIREIEQLKAPGVSADSIGAIEAEALLNRFPGREPLYIRLTLTPHEATDCGLRYNNEHLLIYDMNFNTVNGIFYTPEQIDSKSITAEILIDRTSIEVWIDGGRYSYSMDRPAQDANSDGFRVFGNRVRVEILEVAPLRSIW